MSQAIVDPAELRRFANNLKFNQELEERMTSLRGAAVAGNSWRDQELKFTDDF
jgi:hypothetical protein